MNIAVILSGGAGTRVGGGIPKQYIEVAGKPLFAYCLETFQSHPRIDAVQIVAEESWRPLIRRWAGGKLRGFSAPGETRQLSICNALEDILAYAPEDSTVILHDAARPLVAPRQIDDCVGGCGAHDGVMPVLPMKDTVYLSDGRRVTSLLDRASVCAGQSPEAFLLGKYYRANRALFPDRIRRINGSTEPAVLAGLDVALAAGDDRNFKITTSEDLARFRRMMEGSV